MKIKKIFNNLILIPIIAIMILFTFSSNSEASIADFVNSVNTKTDTVQEQANVKRWVLENCI